MKKVLRATCPGMCALAPGSKPVVLKCSSLTRDPMHCLFQQYLGMYCMSWMLERILCSIHSKYRRTVGAGRDLCGLSGAAHSCEHNCQPVLLQRMAGSSCAALLCCEPHMGKCDRTMGTDCSHMWHFHSSPCVQAPCTETSLAWAKA